MSELSDEEVTRTRNDLEMVRRPHLWTHAALPMKQWDGRRMEHGVIVRTNHPAQWVWVEGGTAWVPASWVGTGVLIDESGVRELLADGWVVD